MYDTYRKLLGLLTPRERRSFFVVLGLVLVMGFVETVGVAAIVPFMLVLADPSAIERHAILGQVYAALSFTDPHSFMLFLGGVVFVVVVGGLLFKAFAFYAVYRFTMMRSYTISNRMLRGYLFQPYTWFLNRHSAEIGANILGDVAKVTTKALLPAMKVLTYGTVVVGLVVLLVLVRPAVAFAAAGLLGGSYVLVYARGAQVPPPPRARAPHRQQAALPDRRRGARRHQGREAPRARGRIPRPLPQAGAAGVAPRRDEHHPRRPPPLPARGGGLRRHARLRALPARHRLGLDRLGGADARGLRLRGDPHLPGAAAHLQLARQHPLLEADPRPALCRHEGGGGQHAHPAAAGQGRAGPAPDRSARAR